MLTVAGVGPGNPDYLTMEVYKAIKESENVIAFKRVADSLKKINPNIEIINRVDDALEFIDRYNDLLLLASGDPNFYGIVDFLKKKGVKIKKVLPGLSSFQYMVAILEKQWQKAELISLHGRNEDLKRVKNNSLSIILTDKESNPQYISKELDKMGVRGKLYTGYNLSYENEVILENEIGDDIEIYSKLAIVVIENEMD